MNLYVYYILFLKDLEFVESLLLYTYDGYLIVSERFKRFCINNDYQSIAFVALPKETEFFFVNVIKEITLNYKKREVQFIDPYTGQIITYGKVNRVFTIPLNFGIKYTGICT